MRSEDLVEIGVDDLAMGWSLHAYDVRRGEVLDDESEDDGDQEDGEVIVVAHFLSSVSPESTENT